MNSSPVDSSEVETICQPPIKEWAARARENRRVLAQAEHSTYDLQALLRIRQEVFDHALQYTRDTLGITSVESILLEENDLVLATGHQPVTYHPGILRKNQLLAEASVISGIRGLNIIIDSDVGIGAEILYPSVSEIGPYQIAKLVLSEREPVFLSQRIIERSEIEKQFSIAQRDSIPEVKPQLERVRELYLSLAGKPLVSAQSVIRRRLEGEARYLELPLTKLISISAIQKFLKNIIEDGVPFHHHFNQQLDSFRLERKIRNHANPFPNLSSKGEIYELPFWVIERGSGERRALLLNAESGMFSTEWGSLCDSNGVDTFLNWDLDHAFQIAPRAILITAVLRLLCSDYFIHGLGGARYDAFLDRLLVSYWKVPAPEFAVVSETRYLFPERVARLQQQRKLLESKREIQFHLDKYLLNGTFSAPLTNTLNHLWQQRMTLRVQLIEIKSTGKPAAETTHQLKKLDQEIRAQLDEFYSSIALPTPEVIAALECREFPFYFYR